MGILLIESSSKRIEFGYAENSELILRNELESENTADTLTYFIKEAFEKYKISFREVEYISLSNGPGSFTGLRIGSAISKGICYASGSKLIEIPTLEIIANKHRSGKEIIPLIFSNTRTKEFYFCRYSFESGKLTDRSGFSIDTLENIMKVNKDCDFVINENSVADIPSDLFKKLIDVSGTNNLSSQLELTMEYIRENRISDFRLSSPFYIKEFVPNN